MLPTQLVIVKKLDNFDILWKADFPDESIERCRQAGRVEGRNWKEYKLFPVAVGA